MSEPNPVYQRLGVGCRSQGTRWEPLAGTLWRGASGRLACSSVPAPSAVPYSQRAVDMLGGLASAG